MNSATVVLFLVGVFSRYLIAAGDRQLNCINAKSGYYCDNIVTPGGGYAYIRCSSPSDFPTRTPFNCGAGKVCVHSTVNTVTCLPGQQTTKPTTRATPPTPFRPKVDNPVRPPTDELHLSCSLGTGYYCPGSGREFVYRVCASKSSTTPTMYDFKCRDGTICVQSTPTSILCSHGPQGGKVKPAPKATTKAEPARTTTPPTPPTPFRQNTPPTPYAPKVKPKEKVLDCSLGSGYYCGSVLSPVREYVYMSCPSKNKASQPTTFKYKCREGTICEQSSKTAIRCGFNKAQPVNTVPTTRATVKPPPKKQTLPTPAPNKVPRSKTPMFVMFSIDDGITPDVFKWSNILFKNRRNPNNCPVTVAYNVVEVATKFTLLKKLYDRGNEINSHGTTHRTPGEWWRKATKEQWEDEVVGMTRLLKERIGIEPSEVRGMRAPFLELGGDRVLDMLVENGFKYDTSMVLGDNTLLWPFKIEKMRPNSQKCRNYRGCPKQAHPQLYEVPLNKYLGCPVPGFENSGMAMLDQCQPTTREDALKYLTTNFFRHYASKDKVPFGINMHFAWFSGPYRQHNFLAMQDFLDQITQLKDVWIVSPYRVIKWMEDPVFHEDMKEGFFPPVNC